VVLAALGFDGHTLRTLFTGVATILRGAAATAMPPLLQSAAMRHCPDDPDGASGLYVAAFQVGIMAGSLERAVLPAWWVTGDDHRVGSPDPGRPVLPVVSRGLFPGRPPTSEKAALVTPASTIRTVQQADFRLGRVRWQIVSR
jgi:hypothetical protein